MKKIIILDQHTANQIAAGEVIERPASVIKELIENSLDAKANHFEIRIKNGGLDFMIVQDNGIGIDKEDLSLAFMRYATSKLTKASDLSLGLVNSFGFRGEALPSIASVSKSSIISKITQSDFAYKITCHAGVLSEIETCSFNQGTRIEVRDLFFNVPARLKFIKSPRSETMAIDKMLKLFAFLYPEHTWHFFSDDKAIMLAKETSNLMQRAQTLFGLDSSEYLYDFSIESSLLKLEGIMAAPMLSAKDTRHIHIFINNRLVQDKKLVAAIKLSFRSLLEIGKNPFIALKINIDPSMIDVNVHPRKTEVKFAEEQKIFGEIVTLLGSWLAKTPWIKPIINNNEKIVLPQASLISYPKNQYEFLLDKTYVQNENLFVSKPLLPQEKYADVEILGQLHNMYIILQSEQGLLLLDQHAAHERVMFEDIRLKKSSFRQIDLLLPISINLNHEEFLSFLEHQSALEKLGFNTDIFGERNIALRAIPDFMLNQSLDTLIKDLLSELNEWGQSSINSDIFDNVCATLACHNSIRAGQKLHKDEIAQLLNKLDVIDFNAQCPHGRPMIKWFNHLEIKKWFHRT